MNRQQFLGLFAGALAAGITAVPAFAEGNPGKRPATAGAAGEKAHKGQASLAKRRAVQGTLTKVDGTAPALTLTLETKHDGAVVVTTNADTEFRGKDHDDLTLAGLKAATLLGARVIAQGERVGSDGSKLVAARLVVRPAKQDKGEKDNKDEKDGAQRTVTTGTLGSITSASGTVTGFTVTPQPQGTAVPFVANADTQYSLKGIASLSEASGKAVRVVSKKDGATNVALQVRYPAS